MGSAGVGFFLAGSDRVSPSSSSPDPSSSFLFVSVHVPRVSRIPGMIT